MKTYHLNGIEIIPPLTGGFNDKTQASAHDARPVVRPATPTPSDWADTALEGVLRSLLRELMDAIIRGKAVDGRVLIRSHSRMLRSALAVHSGKFYD